MKTGYLITYFLILCSLLACTTSHDPRVEAAYALTETAPDAALDSIAAIDTLSLSKADRMMVCLTKIKATDKADKPLPYESDILRLIDYYSSHEKDRFYPTALYYAGRIYSESGDYPTALQYFQEVLDLLPENTPQLKLRGCALSQTGAILSDLRLYDEAESYYTVALNIDRQLQDTVNMIYDTEILAFIALRRQEYNKTLELYLTSDSLSQIAFPENIPYSKSNLAYAYYRNGDIKKAITNLQQRNLSIKNDDLRNYYGRAIRIYYSAGIFDTVYFYAKKLIELDNPFNKKTAYYYLLKKELREFVPQDSIYSYVKKYLEYSEKTLNRNSSTAALIQNSYYNYVLHDRKRREAEKAKERMIYVALALTVTVLSLISTTLYFKNRSKARRIKLNEATENIRKLKKKLNKYTKVKPLIDESDVATALREQLRKQLINAANATTDIYKIPLELASSNVYSYIKNRIESKQPLPEHFSWTKLQETVSSVFPEWKQNLNILGGVNITLEAIKTMLLIKCGCTPSELASLLSITKGSVSSRRTEISKKLLGDKYPLQIVDAVIR
ncbi:MAG: tetratricopeptide repeat protein, partial [Paramuribaculum sp.]|nr:tetratricopeptide repeat protein [Paramuribaculum sp.]